jgi:hypothetical protein
MALSIGRIDTEIDLGFDTKQPPRADATGQSSSREEQLAALRPLVLEILEEEFDRINRRHGAAR